MSYGTPLPPPPGAKTLEERKVEALESIAKSLRAMTKTAWRNPGDDKTLTVKQ